MAESDRRKYKRIDITAPVRYKVIIPLQKSGAIKNISEGGICFVADEKMEPGCIVHLEFDLPDEKGRPGHIEAAGEVRWQEFKDGQYITGIKFLK